MFTFGENMSLFIYSLLFFQAIEYASDVKIYVLIIYPPINKTNGKPMFISDFQ